ncbi:MAG: alpha/beta fold hydrolase [Pseudomonadota bacterium]
MGKGDGEGEGKRGWPLALGAGLLLAGVLLAHWTQTANGIDVRDVRFASADGTRLSALLYVPPGASVATPAPGVLAVHGYINSREAQSGFAIEFARRGYVVLALDQPGHGYSDPPAFAQGFGGPAALEYLRGLPFVDDDNIGLEGHSMGGWSVLAAAAAYPEHYRALVLEGSSTGAPFAEPGTPTWPRNLAVVFSAYDEFAELMWGVDRALDVVDSPKLKSLFGTADPVVPGRIYGDLATGTARRLTQPPVTHPGDHLSHAAIGDAIDWFALTLEGGQSLAADDQRWLLKELGTLLALIGLIVLMPGVMTALLRLPLFEPLQRQAEPLPVQRGARWWLLALLTALVPAATFYLFFDLGERWLPASAWLPQGITNQVLVWALGNAVIGLILTRLLGPPVQAPATGAPKAGVPVADVPETGVPEGGVLEAGVPEASVPETGVPETGLREASVPETGVPETGLREAGVPEPCWLRSAAFALAVIVPVYGIVVLVGYLLHLDFRFWFVGLKVLSVDQFRMALLYLVPFCLYFLPLLRGLHGPLAMGTAPGRRSYLINAALLAGGLAALLLLQYGLLFSTGQLWTPNQPLNTIIMIQFVPLLIIVALLSTSCFRRTGDHRPGALICGLFVTWYVVAGQATQVG